MPRRPSRTRLAAMVIALVSVASSTHPAVAASAAPDAWGPAITFRTPDGGFATPIHASVMPDGQVLFIGYERPERVGEPREPDDLGGFQRAAWSLTPDPLGVPFPAEVVAQPLEQPVEMDRVEVDGRIVTDDFFCSGHAFMADGRLLVVGGTRSIESTTGEQHAVAGLSYASVTDGAAWDRLPGEMSVPGPSGEAARWYPTVTRLADGRMLITSGFDRVTPVPGVNISTEVYDPTTGTFAPLSAVGETPFEVINSDYTHAFVLPRPVASQDVLTFGEPGVPALLSTSMRPGTWFVQRQRPRPGSEAWQEARAAGGGEWVPATAPNNGASSAMLPIRVQDGEWGYSNGSVLVAGGAHATGHEHAADVYDPMQNTWRPTIDLVRRRHHPSTVLLPDGRMLVVAGHSTDSAVTRAQYVDPSRGFAVSEGMSDSGIVRGYHTVSVLLPDGRVLVGGGRDVTTSGSTEKATFQYYYPHYMFVRRPQIVAAPERIGYQEPFLIGSTGASVEEIVLVALGSMTHSIDTNQRSVQVPVMGSQTTSGGYTTIAVGPASAAQAPPGHYMLFALDGNRVPSMARIVRIG